MSRPVEIRPLNEREKSILASYIPKQDLDRAVLHIGDLPFYADLVITPSALTRDADIFIADPNWTSATPKGIGLIAHELVHVTQYRLGMNWLTYLWSVKSGYASDSVYEAPAYAMQDRVVNDLYGALEAEREAAAREAAARATTVRVPPEGSPPAKSKSSVSTANPASTGHWVFLGAVVFGAATLVLVPKRLS